MSYKQQAALSVILQEACYCSFDVMQAVICIWTCA